MPAVDGRGTFDVRRFCAEMASRRGDFASHVYPGVGHGFLCGLADDESAARDSRGRTLAYLTDSLGDQGVTPHRQDARRDHATRRAGRGTDAGHLTFVVPRHRPG
jgi:hypothetical protein